MTGLLTRLVIYGLKRSIRNRAEVGARDVSGSVGAAICALPLIVSIIFGVFAYFAISDPDPQDKLAGYVVAFLSASMLTVFIHFVSHRIVITGDSIYSGSLILGERLIQLEESFRLDQNEDAQQLYLTQKRVRIKFGWTLNGYEDLRRLVTDAHQKQIKKVKKAEAMATPRKPSDQV